MKGIILAGGEGTRLQPLTCGVNKHALPVNNLPMIAHPFNTLKELGCDEILIVTNQKGISQLQPFFAHIGEDVLYAIQENAKGLTHALLRASDFVKREPFYLILGDCILTQKQRALHYVCEDNAVVYTMEVDDPRAFGVYEPNGYIREKPLDPKSNTACIGLYYFPEGTISYARDVTQSARGEYEITTLLNFFAAEGRLIHEDIHGEWIDAGTIESYSEANVLLKFLESEGVVKK